MKEQVQNKQIKEGNLESRSKISLNYLKINQLIIWFYKILTSSYHSFIGNLFVILSQFLCTSKSVL